MRLLPPATSARRPVTKARALAIVAGSAVILIISYAALSLTDLIPAGPLGIIRKAACDANAGTCTVPGLGGITSAADALINPVIVAVLAIAPFALVFGFGAVMVGSRRGALIAGSAIVGAILVVGTKGIVA